MNSPGFSADLRSFDLLDLVQVIHLDRRDLCLVVRAGQQMLGVLRFRQGELLWAEFGEKTGEAAFLALAAQQYGSLEQLPWVDNGERNVYQPLSRLIMQAVSYRDQQGRLDEEDTWQGEGWEQRQDVFEPPLMVRADHDAQQYSGSEPATALAEMEDVQMPDWMRYVSPSVEEIAAQPTGAMPLGEVLGASSEEPTALLPGSLSLAHRPPAQRAVATGEQPGQVTGAFSMLNGKRSLPGLPRAAPRGGAVSAGPSPEDPPTVPLPSVPGGLLGYAPRRDQPDTTSQAEQGAKPGSESEADEGAMTGGATSILTALASAGSLVSAPVASAPASEGGGHSGVAVSDQALGGFQERYTAAPSMPGAASPQPAASGSGEARPSSLSLLEQLAYGGARHGSVSEMAASVGPLSNSAAAPSPAASLNDAVMNGAAITGMATNGVVGNGAALAGPALTGAMTTDTALSSAASATAADTAGGGLVGPVAAEVTRKLREALEGFALQVGPAFLATAILRAGGVVVAQHTASKRVEQDLSSAAYHLAQVMQSSLRALLMGGWGDLDETLITGSTHTVVLRRLGWAEKGLFHMAVLERSGNHGLCRVLMRNAEPVLWQLLAPR